jgi:hypothetical protein
MGLSGGANAGIAIAMLVVLGAIVAGLVLFFLGKCARVISFVLEDDTKMLPMDWQQHQQQSLAPSLQAPQSIGSGNASNGSFAAQLHAGSGHVPVALANQLGNASLQSSDRKPSAESSFPSNAPPEQGSLPMQGQPPMQPWPQPMQQGSAHMQNPVPMQGQPYMQPVPQPAQQGLLPMQQGFEHMQGPPFMHTRQSMQGYQPMQQGPLTMQAPPNMQGIAQHQTPGAYGNMLPFPPPFGVLPGVMLTPQSTATPSN